MAIYDIDGILKHLEKKAADELALLESTGAEFFSTADLLRLRGQWEIKNLLFRQLQRLLIYIAAGAPGWLLFWGLFDFLGWTWLALVFLALTPVSYLVFFAGLLFMRYFFRGKGHLEKVGEMIVVELRKRSKGRQPS